MEGGVEGMWTPGPVPNERGSGITLNSTIADGLGVRVSQDIVKYDAETQEGAVYPATKFPSGGLVVGGGASISVQQELTYPIHASNPNSQAARIGTVVSAKITNMTNQFISTLSKLDTVFQKRTDSKKNK
jgi:hypothetical protein